MKIIKISINTNVKNAIDHIEKILNENINEIVYICALSLAISKLILIVEIIKTKVLGLHQLNNIDCLVINNTKGEEVKRLPKMEVLLSRLEPSTKGAGYQSPFDMFVFRKAGEWKTRYVRGANVKKRGSNFKISSKYIPD
jgi:hypothetical protein